MMPTFTVIDNATGKEVDKWSSITIDEPGWEISLKDSTFVITEDGRLCFVDMWGEVHECPESMFTVVFKKEASK